MKDKIIRILGLNTTFYLILFTCFILGGSTASPKFSFFRPHSKFLERMLNNEERMKLIHFRRFFHDMSKDEFMSRVNLARKRVSRLNRRNTKATLDEDGAPLPTKSSKQR